MTIHGNKFTDSYTERPQPRGVGKLILSPSPRELKAIRAGYKGGFCYEYELRDLQRKAATRAANLGAKSWSIFPMLEDKSRRVLVEYYNWSEVGIYNFDHIYGRNTKKWYWWFTAALPAWWTDPERAVGVSKEGDCYDPRR